MNESDKNRFAAIMKGTSELYEKTPSKELMKLYFVALERFDINQIAESFTKHLNDAEKGMFMPKPADIIRNIEGTKKDKQICFETVARSQWVNVMRAIAEVGSYRTPNFKDPITRACITSAGGWQMICSKTVDELVWEEKSFIRNYQDYSTKPVEFLPDHVVGMEDLQQGRAQGNEVLKQLMDGVNR